MRSPAHQRFARWANEYMETTRVQLRAKGANLRGGTAQWWQTLDDDLRCFVLTRCAPDDWERYMAVPWGSLPEGLRSCIGVESRALMRALQGCTWR